MENKLQGGLRETPIDERDFALGAITKLPPLETLPESFQLETLEVKNQGNSDFCAAYASCTASELQEWTTLSPEWLFAASKKISGDVDQWGQDLRTILKTHKDYGAVETKLAPFSVENKDTDFLRRIENWPDLFNFALPHKKKSYFKVTGQYDCYDNIKASIYKFKDKRQAVITGIVWSWPLSDKYLTGTSEQGFGHAVTLVGWTPEGLILQNSAGKEAGEGGFHIISRETVNYFVGKYGAYMFVDLSEEEAKYYLDRGIQLEEINILTKFVLLLTNFLKYASKTVKGFTSMVGEIYSDRN